MSVLKPALTAEEWAVGEILPIERSDTEMSHAMAALFLHDSDFGFSWDDVDLLTEQASDAIEHPSYEPPWVAQMIDVAYRIRALLPPRERR